MTYFTTRIFPALLVLVAAYLSGREWLSSGESPLGRRLRRTLASVVVVIIAWHIWTGQLPSDTKDPQVAMDLLRHWSKIFLYVLVLVSIALWDAWEGIRSLRRYLETVERDEVGRIQDQVREQRMAKILQEAQARPATMKPTFIDEPLRD